jgi:TRAP-type C4-dicarboxylate transport system substrate-binding protein
MNKGRKGIRGMAWGVTAGVVAFALVGGAADAFAVDGAVEVRMVTLAPMGTSPHVELLKMGERWQKASKGRVKVNVIASYRAGGEGAIVDKMRVGGVDAGLMTMVGLSKIDPGVNAMSNIPMIFQSLEEVDYVQERLGGELARCLEQKGSTRMT